jgi:hypothetical protein
LAAALEDVCFSGALRCARALAFAVFEFLDVVLSRIVVDAFVAASFPVTFLLIIWVLLRLRQANSGGWAVLPNQLHLLFMSSDGWDTISGT